MNARPLIIAVLIFFSFTPTAFAVVCGPGATGTCRVDCNADERYAPESSYICTGYRSTPKCCIPTSATSGTTACPAGQVRDFNGICFTPSTTSGGQAPAPTQPGTGGPAPTQPGTGDATVGTNITLLNPLQGGESLESFLGNILKFVIRIGTIIVILMMVYVGYKFVAARGEPAKIIEARQALLWTVVGALILLGAQAIALGIKATIDALSVGQ